MAPLLYVRNETRSKHRNQVFGVDFERIVALKEGILMQGKNSSKSMQPKSGDGTQDVRRKQDANWYGKSQEPQEEFASDNIGEGGRHRLTPEPADERSSNPPPNAEASTN